MPKKQTKSVEKAVEDEPISVAPAIERGKSLLIQALDDIEAAMAKLGKKLRGAKVHDEKKWSHHMWLTERSSLVLDKLRKLRSDELKDGRNLNPALVRSYFEQLEAGERARWVREINAMDDHRSVLS